MINRQTRRSLKEFEMHLSQIYLAPSALQISTRILPGPLAQVITYRAFGALVVVVMKAARHFFDRLDGLQHAQKKSRTIGRIPRCQLCRQRRSSNYRSLKSASGAGRDARAAGRIRMRKDHHAAVGQSIVGAVSRRSFGRR